MKKYLASLLALVMCLSLLAACGDPGGATSGAPGSNPPASQAIDPDKQGSTAVTIGYVGGHYACYPSSANSDDFIQQGMVYDKLFEVDDNTGEYTSRVLSSWE